MANAQRHLIRAVFSFWLLTALFAHAQVPLAEPPSAKFRVISMDGLATFFFDVEKKQEELNAGVGAFSSLYPAPKNREVVFYKETPNPDPKLPPLKAPVAKAVLPGREPGPFLIILVKNSEGAALAFNATVIDHSLTAHPSNNYRVFNFSKRRLAVNIADSKMVLSTAQHELAPYPATRKAWIQVAADEKDAGWLLVSSSPHPVGPNTRTTVILVDFPPSKLDPNPKGIVARRIRETIETDSAGIQHIR